MSDKLHIAVDLDDVVIDFFQGVIDSMNKEFGTRIEKKECTSWDGNPVKMFDWASYGYKSWWEWLRTRDWLWATFTAIDGAIGGVHALRAAGFYVECVTSKPAWAEPQVWRWIGKWRPAFQSVTIVDLDHPKHEVSSADILIDDKPDNIEGWVNSADDRRGILYVQPWNHDFKMGDRVVCAWSWAGVVSAVKTLEMEDEWSI